MAIYTKDGQRKVVEDHLEARIAVLKKQGWKVEPEPTIDEPQAPKVTKKDTKPVKDDKADAAV
jgi:hypothetical protein